jgi:hypothetical protein
MKAVENIRELVTTEISKKEDVRLTSGPQSGDSGVSSGSEAQSSNGNDQQNNTKVTTLEIKVRTFEGIATTLHKETERILNVLDEHKKEIDDAKRMNDEKSRKIMELERKLANNEVQVTKLTQRVLSYEVASYNGEIVWRLDNWGEHREKAVSGAVTSIFSPPFYTSKYGYKMCVRYVLFLFYYLFIQLKKKREKIIVCLPKECFAVLKLISCLEEKMQFYI